MAAGIAIDHWSEIARRHGVDLANRTRELYDVIGMAGAVPQTAYLNLFGDEGRKLWKRSDPQRQGIRQLES
jgi:hypothetical protein